VRQFLFYTRTHKHTHTYIYIYISRQKAISQIKGTLAKLKNAATNFTDPCLLLLCLGGAVRNGAGLVFAYNIIIFFDEYHPGVNVSDLIHNIAAVMFRYIIGSVMFYFRFHYMSILFWREKPIIIKFHLFRQHTGCHGYP